MRAFIWLIVAILLIPPKSCFSAPSDLVSELRSVIDKAGWTIGLSVINTETGSEIISIRGNEPLKPASVLKILTTYSALDILGTEYTFGTDVYGHVDDKGFVPELVVRGGGDPNLTLEEIWKMGRALKERGVKEVGSLRIDDSLFQSKSPSGIRAYEAGSAPLACSFNSILFRICPTSTGQKATVTFDPWEPNVTISGSITTVGVGASPSFAIERSSESKLSYQVSGGIPSDAGCVTVFRNVSDAASYCTEVIRGIFSSVGISYSLKESKNLSRSLPLIYRHESIPLSIIVRNLNHFSTNFIAEEIVYALGQDTQDRWSYQSGLKKISALCKSFGFEDVTILDGSGLSHANRIPARLISEVLVKASHNDKIGPEIESSLPIAGRSGTLKKRDFGTLDGVLRGKTGSLDGVSSLAGYVRVKSGARFAFTIFQNGSPSKDRALELEHKIVDRIAELG